MSGSSLKFGTSGLRGLASELDGPPAEAYCRAFASMLLARGAARPGSEVLVGRDLRPTSESIARACHRAVGELGLVAVDCGEVPTPALALCGFERRSASIMVTGSHIPADRNGLKFYRPDAEIDKQDEAEIVGLHAGAAEAPRTSAAIPADVVRRDALGRYRQRYLDFFAGNCLAGMRVGIYQHSSVARDLLADIIEALGATAVPLGRAPHFVPVDTEAVREEDRAAARDWSERHGLDAIVSTDGDADRPLIADENGRFLRGDLVGALTARYLGAGRIVTPVTSNSALERLFVSVVRTRVGSPHVIAAMNESALERPGPVIGFEANGGVLVGSAVERGGQTLGPLATRDAMLPILGVLAGAVEAGRSVGEVAAGLAFSASAANRIENVADRSSAPFLRRLADDRGFATSLFAGIGPIVGIDETDGVRISCANGEVVHYRASGNAPELRCYVESPEAARAEELLVVGLEVARTHMTGPVRP